MSRVTKWKLEKTKVKVVFRFQFHATHIPQSGWDKLFISFIPADSGKPTAKTTKANVRNGSCKWADPIYETTRLLQDSKSKQYDEKLYKIVVAMGSSRASTLGEATINLADYFDALKPAAVTLPLNGCNFGTVLHITVQLLTSKTGFREFEQQRELRERGLQSGVDGHGHSVLSRVPHSEVVTSDQTNKVSARIKLKADASELSSLDDGEVNLNEECSSTTSRSFYAEKHEIESLKSTTSGDLHALSHCQRPCTVKEDPDHQNSAQGTSGSGQGWGSGNSLDNELAMACEENNQLKGSLELAESSFFNLKLEVDTLQSLADELGSETQKFSQQLSAEISSAEELAKEVSSMKSECLKFKDDLNRLKDINVSPRIQTATMDSRVDHSVRNIQLQFLDGISVVERKIREIQKKACVLPKDGDTEFIYLELEALLNFLLDFKLGNGEVTSLLSVSPSDRADVKEIREPSRFKDEQFASGNGLDLDFCEPEGILQNIVMNPPISEGINSQGVIDAMKGQIFDLVRELDEAKVEKEALTRKMGQMECYYEALIQELEENQKRLVLELQHLRNEHTTCLYAFSVSKTEVESLREEMNQQMIRFVDERLELETNNKELERRATTSEAALRRARLNYSIAVDKLQKDLELLSSQVFSMFETNENLIKQALPSQTDAQDDQKLHQNSEDDDVTKLSHIQNQSLGLRRRSVGGDVLLEDLKRSFLMQEELYQKAQEELIEMYLINLNLDVYSKALEQSLYEADAGIRIMERRMGEIVEELKLSTASQNHLVISLQKATDEINTLNESKSRSISQCSDLALQNQILEDKLVSISEEKHLSQQLDNTNLEIRSYQSKYAACLAENAELSLQIKHEAFENENRTNELPHLKEQLVILKAESDELISSKENLAGSINFVEDKLANLLSSHDKKDLDSMDVKDAILKLEEIHHDVCAKNLQLMKENQNLESEKADADVSLSTVRSEILTLKQKFKSSIQDMVLKLDVSNSLVDKLQAELESVANKIHLSSEIEEQFAQQNQTLLADLALLDDHIQELTSKNGLLSQEISGLDSLAEEFERNKVNITELMHDKQELDVCLQEKTQESVKLSCENGCLKETLETLRDELHNEKAYKDKLEGKVRDLTICSSKDQDKLLEFEHQKDELLHVRELVSDLQTEKSRLAHLLGQQNELIVNLEKDISRQAIFESQLLEMDHYSLAADIRLIYVSNHYKGKVEELLEKLVSSEECLQNLQKRYHDTESMLNDSCACEIDWRQEKEDLLVSVASLRSDLEVSAAQNKVHLDSNNEICNQLEQCKMNLTNVESRLAMDRVLQASSFESQLLEMHHGSLAADVKNIYISNHYEAKVEELLQKLVSSEECLQDLLKRYHETESMLGQSLACETDWRQEKGNLLASIESLKSDLEVSAAQNKLLSDSNNKICNQLEECKKNLTNMESHFSINRDLQASSFEIQLLETHHGSLAADVRNIYISNHYEAKIEELLQKLVSSEVCIQDLQKRFHEAESKLTQSLACETDWRQEKGNLLASIESLKSDLEVSATQNKLLSDLNNKICNQLEECKKNLTNMESCFSKDSVLQASEVERVENKMKDAEEEINFLTLSKEQLEILVIVLKGKVDEQNTHITLLDEYKEELMRLRSQFNELSHKLAVQVLKTEEFKNLSTHLKELKDKAEAECLAAREKRETEAPSATMQDSLRIAFIKEQCETKVHELKQQLSISKKHGEEMLLKLQDAIDEIENRKKSEAVSLKKNEELSVRLMALEAELMSALSEKREKSNSYDRIKAELECALLSLECCKEEKEKLEVSLLEFEAEKSKLATELTLVKEQLEDAKSFSSFGKNEYCSLTEVGLNGSTGNSSPLSLKQDDSMYTKRETCFSAVDGEIADLMEPVQLQKTQDSASFPLSNGKSLDVKSEYLGTQRLRSSIEHLHEELEKMKNENTLFNIDHDADSDFQVTHKEITQLHKANEELRSMFPSYCDISSEGNALDRVLALEIELAESLKTKNKSNVQFQSSFLKQHSDEEAVFKSFRDINELIREMLELKGRHAAMDAELREMHDRYSQLSLQFAEVEGERQKLKMTLKNVRSSKKLVSLNRSSSDDVMEHPSY